MVCSNWLTDGPEKAWALRIMGLGGRVGYTVAGALTPWLAATAGWQAIPYTLGAAAALFGVVWQLFATERPAAAVEACGGAAEEKAGGGVVGKEGGGGGEKSMEWRIFTVGPVLGATAAHFASNNLGYLFLQWSPTYYNEVLHISNVAAGAFISLPLTIAIWLPFLIGALENKLRAQGLPLLTIRKKMTLIGSAIQTACTLLFIRMHSPILACAYSCGVTVGACLHGSGYSPNYLEVITMKSAGQTPR